MIKNAIPQAPAYDVQAQLFKVLTHPARISILSLLRDGEQCVCHLEAHTGLRQAYISQQLAVLREAGLIADRRDGWNVYYHVSDERIFEVLAAVEKMYPGERKLAENEMHGGKETRPEKSRVECPCPKCSPSVSC